MSELSAKMRSSGVGVRLESGEIVNFLLFADDIILISNSPETLELLKGILETWCINFRMKISISKTNMITLLDDLICSIQDPETLYDKVVNHVTNYKYLGIQQYSSSWRTSQRKGQDMVDKARMYKNVNLLASHQLLDNIISASAIWQNIAIPGILLEIIRNNSKPSRQGVTRSPPVNSQGGGTGRAWLETCKTAHRAKQAQLPPESNVRIVPGKSTSEIMHRVEFKSREKLLYQ